MILETRKKENVLREMFGRAKFKKSTEKILKEIRKEIESKWMR